MASRADPVRARGTSQTGVSRRRAGAVSGVLSADLRGCQGSRSRLQGHVRQGRLLGSRCSSGGRVRRAGLRTRKPKEDPLDDGGVVDRRHQLRPPGTARTAKDIQAEGAAHQRRPRPVAGRGSVLGRPTPDGRPRPRVATRLPEIRVDALNGGRGVDRHIQPEKQRPDEPAPVGLSRGPQAACLSGVVCWERREPAAGHDRGRGGPRTSDSRHASAPCTTRGSVRPVHSFYLLALTPQVTR